MKQALGLGGVAVVAAGVLLVVPSESRNDQNAVDPERTIAALPQIDTADMQPEVAQLLRRVRSAVKKHPRSAEAWGRFGAACEVHMLMPEAADCYREAKRLAPDAFRWTYFLAITLDVLGTTGDEPIELFRQADSLRSNYPPLFVRLGDALAKRGRPADARDAYRRAIELDPDLAIAQFGLGQVLLALGDVREAVAQFEAAAELAPTDGPLFGSLAQAYLRLGDRARAEQAAETSRRLHPVLVLVDPVRAGVYAMGISSRICYKRAGRILGAGGSRRALPYLKTLERVQGDDPMVHVWSAFAHLRMSDRSTALRYFRNALRLRERLVRADRDVAPVPVARRRTDEAIVAYLRAHVNAVKTDQDAQALFDATRDFRDVLLELPVKPEDRIAWGDVLRRIGHVEEALVQYQTAERFDPTGRVVQERLADVYDALGDADRAAAHRRLAAEFDAQRSGSVADTGGRR